MGHGVATSQAGDGRGDKDRIRVGLSLLSHGEFPKTAAWHCHFYSVGQYLAGYLDADSFRCPLALHGRREECICFNLMEGFRPASQEILNLQEQ